MLSGQEIRTDEPIRMLLDIIVSKDGQHIFGGVVLQFVCAGNATTRFEGCSNQFHLRRRGTL